MNELITMAEQHGLAMLMAGFLIYIFFKSFTDLKPTLDEISKKIVHYGMTEEGLKDVVANSNKALEQVSKSNDNVAHSLNLLNKTMEHTSDVTKKVEHILHEHDNRSERIYTLGRENRILSERILTNQMGEKEAKSVIRDAKDEVQKRKREEG